MPTAEKRVVISPDADSLTGSVAARFLDRVAKWGADGRTVHVGLAGGVIIGDVLDRVGAHPGRDDVDWSRVHFWWVDERFVPRDSDERNEAVARRAFLDTIDVPAENIHPIAASDEAADAEAAASAYASDLAAVGVDGAAWPVFDICFLGVGPDGHIASLFPDRGEIRITDSAVSAVHDSPKPPADRVTLTRPVINASKRVWMVLAGPDKSAALGLALAGASYHSVPAAGAKGTRRTILFTDEATAAQVPPELIDDQY
ncbi:6-phosphogluconolactonase [Microbacterium sp. cf332]|uniref:6-phosphogluconolactonase n=1 Tax=Microbacterium sp. cf332 TaxID=1761804 RepID=UPI00088121EB|nr:6-phosphogluconolactonase [Microbacterium sp. cf332]SDQ17595.1 6-phosphogluconolactonase [Microbacterium sp. cf332]